ncbi:MAG: YcxB family protein [Clostridium sp.]|nr:YcxB family protein [Clostridium sp.]
MYIIDATYRFRDVLDLNELVSKVRLNNYRIITKIITRICAIILFVFSTYIILQLTNSEIFLCIGVTISIILFLFLYNFLTIKDYYYYKKSSDTTENKQIIFNDDFFSVECKSEKLCAITKYNYSTIKNIYEREDTVIIMLENPVQFILIPNRNFIKGEYNQLIEYLKLKVNDKLIQE